MKLIDADELEKVWTIASPEPYSTDAAEVLDSIRGAPTVDAVPVVHGRWESVKNPKWPAYSHDKCSICGWQNTRNALCYEEGRRGWHSLNYCPNCGAKMDGGNSDEAD